MSENGDFYRTKGLAKEFDTSRRDNGYLACNPGAYFKVGTTNRSMMMMAGFFDVACCIGGQECSVGAQP